MVTLRDVAMPWMHDFVFDSQEEADEFQAANPHIYFKQIGN